MLTRVHDDLRPRDAARTLPALPCCHAADCSRHQLRPPNSDYGKLLASKGERAVTVRRCDTVEEVLQQADVSEGWAGCGGWGSAVHLSARTAEAAG